MNKITILERYEGALDRIETLINNSFSYTRQDKILSAELTDEQIEAFKNLLNDNHDTCPFGRNIGEAICFGDDPAIMNPHCHLKIIVKLS